MESYTHAKDLPKSEVLHKAIKVFSGGDCQHNSGLGNDHLVFNDRQALGVWCSHVLP